jgi:hypothetical protein
MNIEIKIDGDSISFDRATPPCEDCIKLKIEIARLEGANQELRRELTDTNAELEAAINKVRAGGRG